MKRAKKRHIEAFRGWAIAYELDDGSEILVDGVLAKTRKEAAANWKALTGWGANARMGIRVIRVKCLAEENS